VCWIGSKVWPYPRALIPRERLSVLGEAALGEAAFGEAAFGEAVSGESGAGGGGRTSDEAVVPSGPTDLLASSLFVDPPDDAVRLWAIDLALRCSALAAVVADARGLTMAASRRLQLAAEKSLKDGGPLVLLARPLAERATPSVAGTRWLVVRDENSSSMNPRWGIEVLRWKGRGRAVPSGSPSSGLACSGLSLAAASEVGRRWTLEWRHAESDVVESPVVVDAARESERAPGCEPSSRGGSPGDGSTEFLETLPPRGIAAAR
jgi:hypothetical protein